MEHEVGNIIAMVRSLCELEWEKRKRRGVRYWDEGEKPRADEGAGKRGAYSARARRVRRHATAMRVRLTWASPPAASAGHAVTATRQM
jgi:hypothetical protein